MSALADSVGVRVDFAFLCDAASAGPGGKLEAFGVGVDTFAVEATPCLLPLLFVARLSGVESASPMAARVINADGVRVMERQIEAPLVQTGAGRPWKLPVLAHLFVPVGAPGDYRLDLLDDRGTIHAIPFWVEPAG